MAVMAAKALLWFGVAVIGGLIGALVSPAAAPIIRWPLWRDEGLLTAWGTVGALVLAILGLFFGWVRDWWMAPQLDVTFGSAEPWCRWTRRTGSSSSILTLFCRLRVRNTGRRTARGVRVNLVRITQKDGLELVEMDPFMLHWVGSTGDLPNGLDLLSGQAEFADVFLMPTSARVNSVITQSNQPVTADPNGVLISPTAPFRIDLCPQIDVARGIPMVFEIDGQVLDIDVVGENVPAVRCKLQLPLQPPRAPAPIEFIDVSMTVRPWWQTLRQ